MATIKPDDENGYNTLLGVGVEGGDADIVDFSRAYLDDRSEKCLKYTRGCFAAFMVFSSIIVAIATPYLYTNIFYYFSNIFIYYLWYRLLALFSLTTSMFAGKDPKRNQLAYMSAQLCLPMNMALMIMFCGLTVVFFPFIGFAFDSPNSKGRQKLLTQIFLFWLTIMYLLSDGFVFTNVNLNISNVPRL